jgi:hypothetical protein
MKVIQQLIAHLHERGRLTQAQLRTFAERGYWGQYTDGDLRTLERNVGQSYYFQATGNTHGPLWGTGVYTSDSNLGTACVHAGVLKVGEAGVVKVTMVKPLTVFPGSQRHGVNSSTWNTGWPGAYTVEGLGR